MTIIFNLFVNNYFLFIKKANLGNFEDENLIFAASKDIGSLLEMLKSELEEASNCFDTNLMFSNPETFQAIAVHHNKYTNENCTLKPSTLKSSQRIL